jgi:hypothetical protein
MEKAFAGKKNKVPNQSKYKNSHPKFPNTRNGQDSEQFQKIWKKKE